MWTVLDEEMKRRKRKAAGPSAAEKARRNARRAELRAEKKRAAEALARKRSRAAAKGWETRKANKTATPKKKVKPEHARKPAKTTKPSKPSKAKPAKAKPEIVKTPKRLRIAIQWLREAGVVPAAEIVKQLTDDEFNAFLEKPTDRNISTILLRNLGVYPTHAQANRVVKQLNEKERARFLENPTLANWKRQAGSEENKHYYDEDGHEVDYETDDDFNPFWYH